MVRIALLETGLDARVTQQEVARARLYSAQLLPRDGSDGWRTLAEMGQALGLLDGVVTWSRAAASPEPQHVSPVIARETTRVNRAADAFDVAVANHAYTGPMNAAQIVLGTALGLVEPRLPVWKWREGRAGLSAWYDTIALRPSFQSTMPPPL